MTYFETPDHRDAYVYGIPYDIYVDMIAAEESDAEALYLDGEPNVEPDERVQIPEDMVMTVTPADRADLALTLAWEEFLGFGQ